MISSSAMSLKSRVTQIFWVGNAIACAVLALFSAVESFEMSGYEAQLSALAVRTCALIAATGLALAVFSLRKARSISASVRRFA
jgi:hypothetical protein